MFELYAWVFMRVSGVALLLLALGHLAVMHIANQGVAINYAFVQSRWANPFWRGYDWLFLTLGLLHAINGLRIVIEDHVRRRLWQKGALFALYVLGLLLFALGTVALILAPGGRYP